MDATRALPTLPRRLLTFGRHYLEMCIAMCAVGVPLTLGVLAVLGGNSFRAAQPELSLLLIAITLTAPMAAWMLFRGMQLRPTLEMTAAAFIVVIGLIAADALGVMRPTGGLAVGEICGLSCVAMFLAMLMRFDLYTGHADHAM